MSWEIPKTDIAVIGGSNTFSVAFPEALDWPELQVIKEDIVFRTPFGESPPFKLFSIGNKTVLTCRMYGWREEVPRADASRQVFWVFKEAGVKRIISEGVVGAINHLLKPRDIILPLDYIDSSLRKDVSLGEPYLLIMRQAVCPSLHQALYEAAQKAPVLGRVFDRGNYVVTDGRHFESPAEVNMMRIWNGDVVGQSMSPEIYLAREIGACYARLDMVVNYAEGIVKDWEYEELKAILLIESPKIGHILLEALVQIDTDPKCRCADLRKAALIKDAYGV